MKRIQLILTLLSFMLTVLSVQGKAWQNQEETEEKVYLHLAEEVWLTGQRTWFNAYLTEDHHFPPQSGSKVVYIELLNADRHQVLSSKLKVSDGTAKGEFLLPDTLSGGWYQVRAYTQWMRNFSPDAYFKKEVLVVNPFQPEDAEKIIDPQSKSKSPISFYPEGGNLVAGLDNHVVFQVNDTSGQKAMLQAEVLDENDSIAASVALLSHGLGSFHFHPQSTAAYYLRAVTQTEDTLLYAIPPARKQGYVMQVTKEGDHFHVDVKTRRDAAEDIILIALSEGKAVWKEELSHSDPPWSVNIPQRIFAENTGRIVLLHQEDGILAYRLVYIAHKPPVRVSLSLDKKTYEPRENVKLNMFFQSSEGNPVTAQACLVVRKVNPLSESWDHLSIQSNNIGAKREDYLDAWLVMQHHDALDWNSLFHEQEIEKPFTKENEGMVLSGRVTNDQGKPLADTLLLFSIPGQNPKFDYYRTDAQGRFYFPVTDISGEQEVIIQLPQGAGDYHVLLDEKYAQAPSAWKEPPLSPPSDILAQFIEASRKRAEIARIYGLYRKDTAIAPEKGKKKPFRFYGAPNFERNLDDYISLPTFEEVCRELLPGIRLNIQNGISDFDVFDVRTRRFLSGEPTLLLDGVPVFQPELIVNMPPDTIARIETVNRRTYYGEYPLNGTVAIYTKSGKEYLKALSPDTFRRSVSFYNHPVVFTYTYPAAIQPPDPRTPDFRTLLFWKPDVKTDAQGKALLEFYNADETGLFEVIIEGMTADGQPFSQVVRYEVVSSFN